MYWLPKMTIRAGRGNLPVDMNCWTQTLSRLHRPVHHDWYVLCLLLCNLARHKQTIPAPSRHTSRSRHRYVSKVSFLQAKQTEPRKVERQRQRNDRRKRSTIVTWKNLAPGLSERLAAWQDRQSLGKQNRPIKSGEKCPCLKATKMIASSYLTWERKKKKKILLELIQMMRRMLILTWQTKRKQMAAIHWKGEMDHKVRENQAEGESAARDNMVFIHFVNNYIYFTCLYLNEFVSIYENKTKLFFTIAYLFVLFYYNLNCFLLITW